LARGSIEPRAGNFPVFRGGGGGRGVAKVGLREVESECREDFVDGGGMTPIEPHIKKFRGFRGGVGTEEFAKVQSVGRILCLVVGATP
jgi:hypothetical protein